MQSELEDFGAQLSHSMQSKLAAAYESGDSLRAPEKPGLTLILQCMSCSEYSKLLIIVFYSDLVEQHHCRTI